MELKKPPTPIRHLRGRRKAEAGVEKRNVSFNIRVTESEYRRLIEVAERDFRTISELGRMAIVMYLRGDFAHAPAP